MHGGGRQSSAPVQWRQWMRERVGEEKLLQQLDGGLKLSP
jgi:hypothetical protein